MPIIAVTLSQGKQGKGPTYHKSKNCQSNYNSLQLVQTLILTW